MQSRALKQSSPSVKITYLDREGIRKKLRQAAEELARTHPEIERIILFGSLARGDAVPGSDADLLVILSQSNLPFLDRHPHYVPGGCGIGVELFAYTQAEFERMVQEQNPFLKQALKEGVVMFERKDHW